MHALINSKQFLEQIGVAVSAPFARYGIIANLRHYKGYFIIFVYTTIYFLSKVLVLRLVNNVLWKLT